jgi:hypothetical protein
MGAAGPLNPKGRSIAKDPSGQVFWSAAAARSPRSRRGKNLAATVSGGPDPPIGLTPEQEWACDPSGDCDAKWIDSQRPSSGERDIGRPGIATMVDRERPLHPTITAQRREGVPRCAMCKGEIQAGYGPRCCRPNRARNASTDIRRGTSRDRNGAIVGKTDRRIAARPRRRDAGLIASAMKDKRERAAAKPPPAKVVYALGNRSRTRAHSSAVAKPPRSV